MCQKDTLGLPCWLKLADRFVNGFGRPERPFFSNGIYSERILSFQLATQKEIVSQSLLYI